MSELNGDGICGFAFYLHTESTLLLVNHLFLSKSEEENSPKDPTRTVSTCSSLSDCDWSEVVVRRKEIFFWVVVLAQEKQQFLNSLFPRSAEQFSMVLGLEGEHFSSPRVRPFTLFTQSIERHEFAPN